MYAARDPTRGTLSGARRAGCAEAPRVSFDASFVVSFDVSFVVSFDVSSVRADYSPLGTCVLQATEVPARPPSFDGAVLICDLAEDITAEALREALAAYGHVCTVETVPAVGAAVRVRYATHGEAERAVAELMRSGSLPGGAGHACVEYNERAYGRRGWCVAEEIFATEAVLYLSMPPLTRAKAVGISHEASTPARPLQPTARTNKDVLERLDAATFTGKGDARNVTTIMLAHDLRLQDMLRRRNDLRSWQKQPPHMAKKKALPVPPVRERGAPGADTVR